MAPHFHILRHGTTTGLASWDQRRISVVLALWLVNLLLVAPSFFPSAGDINMWDEAAYIHSGQILLDNGEWPIYSDNPLVSVFYALTYLPYRNSPNWFVQSASLARPVLFSLLWFSAVAVASRLSLFAPPLITTGLFMVVPLAQSMQHFPSDPMFAALSGLALWRLLAYYQDESLLALAQASGLLALSAMARNDGLILFGIFLVLVFGLMLRKKNWLAAPAAVVPFIVLVGGYVLFQGLPSGSYTLGTLERTYNNFESGQQLVYSGTGARNPVIESRIEAQRIFGSADENYNSVLRAILRNPQVYLQRVRVMLLMLPTHILHAYGIRFFALLAGLALRGMVELVRKRQFVLLAILTIWPMFLLSMFATTLFREGHLMFPFYIVFVLAAVGIWALLKDLQQGKGAILWILVLLGLVIAGLVGQKLAIYYGAVIFLAGVLLVLMIKNRPGVQEAYSVVALLVLLCAGLVIRGDYPGPVVRTLGSEAREQAVFYLMNNLPENSKVAAASPGPVWMAKLPLSNLTSTDIPVDKSSDEFLDWMRAQNITAIYVDHSLYNENPFLWSLLKEQIGTGLERVFAADEGDIQILLVTQK